MSDPSIEDTIHAIELYDQVAYSCAASLAFLTWEICITLDTEIEHIWKHPPRSSLKWLFLFTRYLPLAVQILLMLEGDGIFGTSDSRASCVARFTFHSLATQAVTLAVEILLMMRVYALYGRSRRVRILLIGVLIAEVSFMVPIYGVLMPKISFDSACIPIRTRYVTAFFAYLSIVALIVQSVLLSLTLFKSYRISRRNRGKGVAIIDILARDGGWVFGLVFVALLLQTIFYFLLGILPGALMFTWYLSLLSFLGCRLVLNLYQLESTQCRRDSASMTGVLTTHIDDIGVEFYEIPTFSNIRPDDRRLRRSSAVR
ncbi:hypothetical protein JAAARDRAFT_478248 [Jaapia argillacea MUCL 33604]|uniref:DUF6533 domain-containing protein n=1 Tax=Jaapia argillacea MUCL 33604 TaxID=933084 RepID=A0A067PFA9_9AGAM|nr:hypothetical protein JAAARDRAFT_478248 [Jaapia argillacea MUCL 33604]